MPVKVCLGGTFNVIHDGHIALLTRACGEGDEIFVGLTSDEMARGPRKGRVNGYATRLRNLAETIERICPDKEFSIREISDEMGPAATGDYDVIVVSRETEKNAERINKARILAGLKPLRIEAVEMVLDHEGKRISATRTMESQG